MAKEPTYVELKQQISELKKEMEKCAAQNSGDKYRILFEKSKDAILIIENEKFVDCNQATIDMLGYKNKIELLKTHPSELSPGYQPDGKDSVIKAKEMMAIALECGSHRFEWDHIRANGEVFPVEVLLTTISNQEGNQVIHTVWRDITNRKQLEKARQEEKETLSTILESTPHGITLIDNHGKYIYVNPHFTEITGYALKDISTKKDWFKKAYPDKEYRKKVSETWIDDSNCPGQGTNREFKIKCKNGKSKYIEFRSTFLKNRKISVLTDVTQRRKTDEALRESEERFRSFVENASDLVFRTDDSGHFTFMNPAGLRITGYKEEELIGTHYPALISLEMSEETLKIFGRQFVKMIPNTYFEYLIIAKDGHEIWLGQNTQLLVEDGRVVGFQAVARDISEQKQAKKELELLNLKLEHRATHDPLTGAPNRLAILDNLNKELSRFNRENSKLSIGLCDIDYFKSVNDKHGHQVGDDVLCGFVKAIQKILRPYDLIGRYGGEEFLIIVPDSTGLAEENIYERVRAEIANHKIITRSGEVSITVSIGATSTRRDNTADEILAVADEALYKAKDNGRNQVVFIEL